MENKEWCHKECKEEMWQLWEEDTFTGQCSEYCQDDKCTYEHADYKGDWSPQDYAG